MTILEVDDDAAVVEYRRQCYPRPARSVDCKLAAPDEHQIDVVSAT
jgi:hypothetical protein